MMKTPEQSSTPMASLRPSVIFTFHNSGIGMLRMTKSVLETTSISTTVQPGVMGASHVTLRTTRVR